MVLPTRADYDTMSVLFSLALFSLGFVSAIFKTFAGPALAAAAGFYFQMLSSVSSFEVLTSRNKALKGKAGSKTFVKFL